jgi:hypothetical protein
MEAAMGRPWPRRGTGSEPLARHLQRIGCLRMRCSPAVQLHLSAAPPNASFLRRVRICREFSFRARQQSDRGATV